MTMYIVASLACGMNKRSSDPSLNRFAAVKSMYLSNLH